MKRMRRPMASSLGISAFVAVAILSGVAHGASVTSSGTSAPLHVALVRWSELQPHTKLSPRPAPRPAASLRAAGYPLSPELSRPPLARTSGEQQASSGKQVSAAALSWATPVPLSGGGGGLTTTPLQQQGHHGSAARRRRLQQHRQQQQQPPHAGFQLAHGFAGEAAPVPGGTSALAVGPEQLLQAAGGLVTLHSLTAAGDVVRNSSRSVALAALLQPHAAAACQGMFDPAAVYDAAAGRFVLSATCGGQGLLLLAVSATSNAAGAWFVSTLVADGVGSPLACTSPAIEAAMADYSQLGYNADGVFVTYKSWCPSNSSAGGVGLLALPKWALYRGMPTFEYPTFAGADIAAALQASAAGGIGSSASSSAAAGAGAGAGAGAETCTQLVPVLPQGVRDVGQGEAHFVCEAVATWEQQGAPARRVIVAALLDTATLWQYGGPRSSASAPLLAAQVVELAAAAPPVTGLPLRQPEDAAALQLGTRPRGFWNGAAVMAHGRLFLAAPSLVASDRSSPSYSRRPAVAWAELTLRATASGIDSCAQSRAGVASRQVWDASKDYSLEWSQVHEAAQAPLAAPPASAAANRSVHAAGDRLVHAAVAPLLAAKALGGAYSGLWAAQSATVSLFQLGASPCTCYACYWGGGYYRYGGYNGGALAGQGSGFASSGYAFYQGQMTRCQNQCSKCWYYGYPGHGFGNVGDDKTFLDLMAAAPMAANTSGATRADGPSILSSSGAALVDQQQQQQQQQQQAALASLFAPCTRDGSLAVAVVRQGLVTQAGQHAVGFAFPALAVGRTGDLLLTYSYAGPGNISDAAPAYAGVGASLIPAGALGSSSAGVVKAGRGTISPASPAAGGWGELSAMALHAPSGTVFAANHYAAAAARNSGWVGTWISVWREG